MPDSEKKGGGGCGRGGKEKKMKERAVAWSAGRKAIAPTST